MKIEYDKNIDAKYIHIKQGKVANTKKEQEWLLFDYDKDGEVLGVEVLESSKHPVSLSTVGGKLTGYYVMKFSPTSSQNEANAELAADSTKTQKKFSVVV